MGGDAKTLIDEKVSLLRSMEDYKDFTVAELNDLAAEEVVADGMELILTDGKVLEELAKTDRSLWEKIRIQREVGKGNLVRVKTKKGSTQASEGTSPIEAAYSEDTSNNSITKPEDSVNTSTEKFAENSSDNLYSMDEPA